MSIRILITMMVIVGAAAGIAGAQETEYQDYQRANSTRELFTVTLDRKDISISLPDNEAVLRFSRRDAQTNEDGFITARGSIVFDDAGLIMGDIRRDYDQIVDTRVMTRDDEITVTFLTRTDGSRRLARLRQGNRIRFRGPIKVDDEEFVRGVVLCIAGDIEVYGEVNKDVVSLFGDIYIGPEAVVRGDVTAITGRLDVSRSAAIYGEVLSHDERRKARRRRFLRRDVEFTLSSDGMVCYNRVDGLLLGGELRFDDPDSLIPSVWAGAGYAFASERWRYQIGAEQIILRNPGLAIGGEFFRRLASEDDWLLNCENSVFALLAKEDFKDYYESEGGRIWTKVRPWEDLTVTTGYSYEETAWLPAHRNLWSLFGGDKKFRENFSTVPAPFRDSGIAEINTKTNGCLTASFDLDTGDPDDRFFRSSWRFGGNLEWSDEDWSSDYEYRRYTLSLRRYQSVTRRTMILLRGMYGGSDGYLPMHKRFFLGGLGTLRGYDHKEYFGTRFWMANAEYRIRFPRTDFAASLLWDVAQLTNDTSFDEDAPVKHSLGIGLHLDDDFTINVSRRLDRSDDNDPKIYVRLEHVF